MEMDISPEEYRGPQLLKIQKILDSLVEGADAIEDQDPTVSEIMLCMNDLLTGVLKRYRAANVNREEWAALDVGVATSLSVITNLINELDQDEPSITPRTQPGQQALSNSMYQRLFDEANRHTS